MKIDVTFPMGSPATCKVWHRGKLIFDGVSREALLQRPPEPLKPLAEMFAEKADQEIEEGRGSPRPDEVTGKWSVDLFNRSHRIVSALYVGSGTVGRSHCGLINISCSLRAYLVDEPPENACKSCLRWPG